MVGNSPEANNQSKLSAMYSWSVLEENLLYRSGLLNLL
jgi:hypothetical protein